MFPPIIVTLATRTNSILFVTVYYSQKLRIFCRLDYLVSFTKLWICDQGWFIMMAFFSLASYWQHQLAVFVICVGEPFISLVISRVFCMRNCLPYSLASSASYKWSLCSALNSALSAPMMSNGWVDRPLLVPLPSAVVWNWCARIDCKNLYHIEASSLS